MKIDPSKKYKTIGGREAIIHAVDGPNPRFPIIASTRFSDDDNWDADAWEASAFVEDREPREWEIAVAKGNHLYPDGYISEARTRLKHVGDESLWELVRVREIIEP